MDFNYRKHSIVITCFVLLIVIFWIFSSGLFTNKLTLVESTNFLMSTSLTVKFYISDETEGETILKKIFTEAGEIEHIMEPLKGDGELQRINNSSSDTWWKLSSELKTVIDRSIFFYEKSNGAFDPTIASVKWLWDFENGGTLPSQKDISETLETVGLSKIKTKGDSLSLGNHGTKLDLGGIAKGYVVDRIIKILKESGVSAGLVNAGGDIYTFGKKPGGKDWVIGFRHPRSRKTIVIDTISLPAVATSGDYERYFIQDGVRYHHILDPSTGYPVRKCASVTVWAETAMDADILATTIFVLGPQKGLEFAEKLDNVETLIFFEKEDGEVLHEISKGVRDKVKL